MSLGTAKLAIIIGSTIYDCIQSYYNRNLRKFYLYLILIFQVLGIGIISLAAPYMEQIASNRATHLAVLIGSPFVLTSMLLRCFLLQSFDLIFLPPLAMTAVASASIMQFFNHDEMPVLLQLPGILLLCIFCYEISSSQAERYLCILYISATFLSIFFSLYYHIHGNKEKTSTCNFLVACCMVLVLSNFALGDTYEKFRYLFAMGV